MRCLRPAGIRELLLALAIPLAACAQDTIAISYPSANQTLRGWAANCTPGSISNCFTVSYSGPDIAYVDYTVDAHPATNPGPPMVISGDSGALLAAGRSNRPPFSFPVNTFWWADGQQHQVIATARNALGAAVATSPPVTFAIANTWPVSCDGAAPALDVATGSPVQSKWSGQVSVSATMPGPCAHDNFSADFFVDGVLQGQQHLSVTSGRFEDKLDTTAWQNGPHNVGTVWYDTTHNTAFSDGAGTFRVQGAAEWSRTVIFDNGAVPSQVRSNAREIFLAPRHTFQLTPTLINADGSAAPRAVFDFASTNPSIATVAPARGASATVTAVAQNSTQILIMAETRTGTDGTVAFSGTSTFSSRALGNYSNYAGRLLRISGGTNCIAGLYRIQSVDARFGTYILVDPATGALAPFATSTGDVHCSWATGPTRSVYALVNPTNPPVAHFSNSGSILTSYVPGSSMVLNAGFATMPELASQHYPVPFLTSVCKSGFNTMEMSAVPINAPNWGASQAAFAKSQQTYLASQLALLADCPRLRVFATGDNIMRTPIDVYINTRGTASTWSPSGVATVFESLKRTGKFVAMSWVDEFPFGQNPLQGPINLRGANAHNWLSGISASNGTCTAHVAPTTLGGWSMWGGFIITGSVTPGMNTPIGGKYYEPMGRHSTATDFTFACRGVANGAYNSANDPDLTIDTMFGGSYITSGWFNPPGSKLATDYIHSDAIASLVNQANSVPGRIPASFSIAGNAGLNHAAVSCANGGTGCRQSIVVDGNTITQAGDFDDQYWTHSGLESYLTARESLNSLISDAPAANLEEGQMLRDLYGSYDPAKPLTTISQGTSTNWALALAQPLPVVSCNGNTITFSSPHHIVNIVPGWSRMTITGSSDPNCNRAFVILAAPSETTVTAAYAATTVSCPDTGLGSCGYRNGGLLTFENGDTLPLYDISSDAKAYPMGGGESMFNYGTAGIYDGNLCGGRGNEQVNRHRGQTFVVSGVAGPGANYFNNTTFIYDIENLAAATESNGVMSACHNYFREIPVLHGAGGSANIIYDGSFVPGRNPASLLTPGSSDPNFAFASIIEAMNLRTAGHRFYQFAENLTAYLDRYSAPSKAGWTGGAGYGGASQYNQGLDNQLYSHPNVESGSSVPGWHAASLASMMWTRLARYQLGAVPRNSPDYGPELDCSAYASPYGFLLMCLNASNGPETRSFQLSPYEIGRQNIVRYTARFNAIGPATVIHAGTPADTVTLDEGEAVFYVFPKDFSDEYRPPVLSVSLADVPNATDIVIRYHYDLYNLDAAGNAYDCGGSGFCAPPVDPAIGTVYYRILYRNASGAVLATSDVQTF